MRRLSVALLVIVATLAWTTSAGAKDKVNKKACTYKNFKLYGKFKVVESFPDIKVKVVDSFPDIKVKMVESFPDKCGRWQMVESFPDVKIKFVESFPDVKIKFVESFPGVP